jgi:uncharacterized membrane protein SirB2
MFSRGQLIFGILFAIIFIIIIGFAYRKDKIIHNKHYSGSFWIFLVFLAFISGIAAIKFLLGY